MSDQRIIEYLRSRGRVEPPLDFVASVAAAVADAPQRRVHWFAPFVPAAAAVGAIAVVTALAVLLSQEPSIGPSPAPSSTSPTAEPSASASTDPSSTPPTSSVTDALLQEGDIATVPAISDGDVLGTITLERGADVGGYPLVTEPSGDAAFFIEVFATYDVAAATENHSWGTLDWRIRGSDGSFDERPFQPPAPIEGRPDLGNWPGATVPEDHYEGWIVFAVPRHAQDLDLELLYQPGGTDEPLAVIPVREPGPAPDPVAAEWPRPDLVYVTKPGLPFGVLESAEADALFEDPDTCTNPEGGYTVTFPESWYTNTAIGDVPACSWFSPTFYEATEGGPVPDEIAIEIEVFEGAVGFIWVDLYTEDVSLDGIPARRYESGETKEVDQPTDRFHYAYLARFDESSEGRKLWASTGTDHGGDYELNRAVLDRIMASLELTE